MSIRGWLTIAIMLALFLFIGFHIISLIILYCMIFGEKGIKKFEKFIS